MSSSIFKGPAFYEEKDQNIFLGREKETAELLYLVENSDFCVCYAESGEGKSSLINAGLQPVMRCRGMFPIHILFNQDDFDSIQKRINDGSSCEDCFDSLILGKLEESVSNARLSDYFNGKYSTLTMLPIGMVDNDQSSVKTVRWKLRCDEFRINAFECIMPVLIFDQFEEVFTRSDISWTNAFFKWLENLYNDEFADSKGHITSITKKFKVLISLRSDFVSELDYWCMHRFFIPSLKNNRYCLKPLTKDSAFSVVRQLPVLPKGIDYDDIMKSAKVERAGAWNSVDGSLPCISALALSLVLTGLHDGNISIKDKLEELMERGSHDVGGEFLFYVMSQIYDDALEQAGIGKDSELRMKLETALVDTNGRKRVAHLSDHNMQSIPEQIIKKLADKRIVVISGKNVEIAHDCLRKVVEKHNADRQHRNEVLVKAAQRAQLRAIRQKHSVVAFAVLFLAVLSAYLFLRLHAYSSSFLQFNEGASAFNYDVIVDILITCALISIPSFCTLCLYLRKWSKKYLHNIITPVTFNVLLFLLFLFYDVVNSPIEGRFCPNYCSFIFVFLVPSFCFSLYQRSPVWHLWNYCLLLTPLAMNAAGAFLIPFWSLMAYMILLSLYILWSFVVCRIRIYNKQHRIRVKVLLILANLAVLWVSVFFQLGFNPQKVDYDMVVRSNVCSANWKAVVVNSNGKYGLINALSGDTIVPIVFNSIDNFLNNPGLHLYVLGKKIRVADNDGCFIVNNVSRSDSQVVTYRISPLYEFALTCYSHELCNQSAVTETKKVAALVYNELRNEVLDCLSTDRKIDIGKITSINKLDNIHKINTKTVLNEVDSLAKNGRLTDSVINKLYRTICSDLCLCIVKDRLIAKDLENTMKMLFLFQICEFHEELRRFSYRYTIINDNLRIKDDDLLGNVTYAQSTMLKCLVSLDADWHKDNVLSRIDGFFMSQREKCDSVINRIKSNSYFSHSIVKHLAEGTFSKTFLNDVAEDATLELSKDVNKLFCTGDYNFVESDLSMILCCGNVLERLLPIVENSNKKYRNSEYNSCLCEICKESALVCMCRWYVDFRKYVKLIKDAESKYLQDKYAEAEEICTMFEQYETVNDEIIDLLNQIINKSNYNTRTSVN